MGLRERHPLKGEDGFAWRGGNPTRVEALTDMVFAFALTLLVVSGEPPRSFPDLVDQLWGFPGFIAAFALFLLVWHSHYIFFRRYALEDGWTTTLNAGLLFIILFFVYPLKFEATMLSDFIRSVAEGAPRAPFTMQEARDALVLLSVAYAAVFFMFALLYRHALARRSQLGLTEREHAMTRFSFWQQVVHVGVPLLVVAVAQIPGFLGPASGFLYFLIGPLIALAGAITYPKRLSAPEPTPGL